MKDTLLEKLQALCARHEEIAGLLSDIQVINDQNRFRGLSVEYAQLEDLVGRSAGVRLTWSGPFLRWYQATCETAWP